MLSERQRDVVFHSLPVTEQNNIKKSYRLDGWEDLGGQRRVHLLVVPGKLLPRDSRLPLDESYCLDHGYSPPLNS